MRRRAAPARALWLSAVLIGAVPGALTSLHAQAQQTPPAEAAGAAPAAPALVPAPAQPGQASTQPVPALAPPAPASDTPASAVAPPAAEGQPQLAPSTTLGAPDAGASAAVPSDAGSPASAQPAPEAKTPEVVAPAALPPAPAASGPAPAVPAPSSAVPAPGAAEPASPVPPSSEAPPPASVAAPGAPGAQPAEKGDAPNAGPPQTPPGKPVDPRIDTGPIVAPPVHAGDSWLYRRSNGKSSAAMRQTAVKVSDDAIALRTELLNSPDNSTVLYDREWGLMASGYNEYRPALHYYSFPLYAGKRWSINTAINNFGAAQTSRVKGEAWATGWERVEVPAGRFLALRIEIDIETSDPGNPERTVRVRETHWYVRTVLRPVKVESHSVVGNAEPTGETVELLSYRMGD